MSKAEIEYQMKLAALRDRIQFHERMIASYSKELQELQKTPAQQEQPTTNNQ